jgi:hypothetical protein
MNDAAGLATVDPDSALGSRARDLPPVDLPAAPPSGRQPLQVTIHPKPRRVAANDDGAWGASIPDFKPAPAPAAPQADATADVDGAWGATRADHSEETEAAAKTLHRDVSGGEAFGRGILSGATFGAEPALEGVAAAGSGARPVGGEGQPAPDMSTISGRASGGAALRPIAGALDLLRENVIDPLRGINPSGLSSLVTGEQGGPATRAYRKARDEAQDRLEQARAEHPVYTLGGELAGGLAAPIPGGSALTQGASLAGRLGRGAAAGAAGGALYGAGSAISKGEDTGDIAKDALINAGVGAGVGAALHGALGPRAAPGAPTTPGQRAAATAAQLGAPLPRGLASDNAAIKATTSKIRSVPVIGSRVSSAVDATQAAAGRRIEEIASGTARVPPDRALAGSTLRPAITDLIDKNNGEIDKAYADLRRVTNTNLYSAVSRTRAALEGILKTRRGARMAKPETGLADVINMVKGGLSFNQLQRARNHFGQVIEFAKTKPNPGFDLAELRRIYAAMTGDMKEAVRRHAHVHPDRAADALDLAHMTADAFIKQNGTLQRLLNLRSDESVTGALLTAAQEKTGNLRMLSEVKAGLPPDDFRMIAGSLLNELGHNPTTGEFSLNKFVTNWDKISKNAKQILFSPQHLQNIEDIAGLGKHIKGAVRESNSSHTAGVLILFDLAQDAIILGATMTAGTMSGETAVAGALATPAIIFAHWLASPAAASSMTRWLRTRAAWNATKTAAALGSFNLATRNLANTLGIPQERIARHVPELTGIGSGPAALPLPAKSQARVPLSQ